MNRFFVIYFTLFSPLLFAQSLQVENYEMIFRKSNVISKNEVRTSSFGINAPAGFKKIQIRFEINTLSGKTEIFDPNKFYLVSESYKIRVRPIDFTYHYFLHNFESFSKLSQEPTENKYGHLLAYKPEVKDSFSDFKISDYEDVDYAMNFGSDKKPFIRKTYSEPKKWNSNLIDIYVIIPEDLNTAQIYYGSQKIIQLNN